MSKTENRDRAQYEKAREAFTKLDVQDKAAFVLEATFSTFGEAFRDAGQQFADVMEKVTAEDFFKGFGSSEEAKEGSEGPSANGKKKAGGSSSSKKKKDEDAE